MSNNMFYIPITILLMGMSIMLPESGLLFAQTNTVNAKNATEAIVFNTKVHNFGKFSIDSGAKNCTFEFTNNSNKPVLINNILSSCGCTTPEWPKKPIMPGEKGVIKVTFLNDQGPYPFDKALTVYTSASTKPIILRVTGVPYGADKSLKQQFPIAIGPLGIRNNTLKMGQLEQGAQGSKNVMIANLSGKPVTVKFTDITPGLTLEIAPQPVPANGMSEITYKVDTGVKENWGSTIYKASVICNGVKASKELLIDCMIIDNFSKLSKEEKNNGPMILAKNSSHSFGTVAKTGQISAVFNLRNTGYRDLKIFKADTNGSKMNITLPKTVKAGEEFTVTVTINPADYSGEQVFTITLITNSPNRPLVNLFVTGTIK